MKFIAVISIVAAVAANVAGDDTATLFKWKGGEGNFSDAANWTVGGNPDSKWTVDGEAATRHPAKGDSIFFPPGAAKVLLTEDVSVFDLKMYGNSANTNAVTLDLGGNSLEALNTADWSSRIDCELMSARTCQLMLTNGVFTITNAPHGLLLGNRSYNHNGALTMSDVVFTGNVEVVGTSLLTVENGAKWILPAGQGFGGGNTLEESHAETVVRGHGTYVEALPNKTLGLIGTYSTLVVSNHAALSCYQMYISKNSVGGGACMTIADHAAVSNMEATVVGSTMGAKNGNSHNTIVVTNNAFFKAGNLSLGTDYGSTGCCIRVVDNSTMNGGMLRLYGMVSNTIEIVDSECAFGGNMEIGRNVDRIDFDNGIALSGARAHFVSKGRPLIMYENAASFISFGVPEDGFVSPDGTPRIPMEVKCVSNLVKTAGYATSSANRIRIKAAAWARRNPRKTITLISCAQRCENELKALADNAELDDPRMAVAVVDGKSIAVTAPGKGFCIVVR